MLRIQQLKLPVSHTKEELEKKIQKTLKVSKEEILAWEIRKQSLDARKKPELFFVYTVDVSVKREKQILKRVHNKNIMSTIEAEFSYLHINQKREIPRPVIVGSGTGGIILRILFGKSRDEAAGIRTGSRCG